MTGQPVPLPVQRLDDTPVLGVSLGHVALLRLDLTGGLAPGNKHFKLRQYLQRAQGRRLRRLVSFGGAWSNHLHALAAMGHEHGLQTVGIVRGESRAADNPALADARRWGMQLEFVDRAEYRRRNDPDYRREIAARYAPCLVIPEGGAGGEGVAGCRAIADMIESLAATAHVVLGVGSGATLAGVAGHLGSDYRVTGISALKGAHDLEGRVGQLLQAADARGDAAWEILHEHHCGGFARVDAGLKEFLLAFEGVHGVPLEPVYTGKVLYAIFKLARDNRPGWREPLLAVHTGGLQGRRGYPWLTP